MSANLAPETIDQHRRLLLASAGALAAAGAIGARPARAASPKAAASSSYATVDGLRVYYELHGAPLASGRAPVVLLHGGVMAIETAFAKDLLPRLARSRPVIAIEQQGHGHTADRQGPITLDRMVDDTAGVLAHLKVPNAHFVGHSMGGMITVGMSVRHPRLVRTATAISASYNPEGQLPELVEMQRNPAHTPSAELIPLLPTEADFKAWVAHYQRTAPDPAAFQGVLGKLQAMLASWKGWSEAELGAIRAPTLLMIGDKDFTRIDHAADMARLIPGAHLAVLPGTTHMSIIDRGDWIEPLLEARIASASPRAA